MERFEVVGEPLVDPAGQDAPDCARRRPGIYTRLKRSDTVFMTDLYDEWFTQKVAVDQALARGGEVLITGLGLGLIVESILRVPASPVKRVTVLERSREVIELVAAHLSARYDGQLEVIEADAFAWRPPVRNVYSVVWHDIWPNPQASETLAEMVALERRYRRCSDWQGSWPREYRRIYEGTPWSHSGGRP